MDRRLWLLLPMIVLSGCRIVSQQELADLKNPPNPKMANIAQTWREQLVPQVQRDAKPAAELLKALQAAKDFAQRPHDGQRRLWRQHHGADRTDYSRHRAARRL